MEPPVIAVLEPNRAAATRMARVLSAVTNRFVATFDEPAELAARAGVALELLICDAKDLDFAERLLAARSPTASCVLLTQASTPDLFDRVAAGSRCSHLLAWPEHASSPRAWELALLGARVIGRRAPPSPSSILLWGAAERVWRPRTTLDRDRTVEEANQWLLDLGTPERTARHASEVAYELVMNAMYDAPVDQHGTPRHAFDRARSIELPAHEAPRVTLATDGMFVLVEVTDPFGTLTRQHVFTGIARGLKGQTAGDAQAILDTSRGGAGLGMVRVFTHGAATMFSVTPGSETRALCVIDADTPLRSVRRASGSISFYAEAR